MIIVEHGIGSEKDFIGAIRALIPLGFLAARSTRSDGPWCAVFAPRADFEVGDRTILGRYDTYEEAMVAMESYLGRRFETGASFDPELDY